MDKRYAAPLALLGVLISSVHAGMAGQTGDMFYDSHYTSTDRPYIPGDRERHADFFPDYQPYIRPDKDMFDHAHMESGVTDMFTTHSRRAPDNQLFNWPHAPDHP